MLLAGRVSSLSAILWQQETDKTRSRQVPDDHKRNKSANYAFSLIWVFVTLEYGSVKMLID